jgi:hypothetical protein
LGVAGLSTQSVKEMGIIVLPLLVFWIFVVCPDKLDFVIYKRFDNLRGFAGKVLL